MSSNEEPQLPDLLAGLKSQGDGYRTPNDAYFADQAERALAAAKKPARSRRMRVTWQYAAAACFLLLLSAFLLLTPSGSDSEQLAQQNEQMSAADLLAQIDVEDIDTYLDSEPTDLETEIFYDNLPESLTDE